MGKVPSVDANCLATIDISSMRKRHARISASMLSEQLGRATALHASTRDSPADTVYRTYPAPPSCSVL